MAVSAFRSTTRRDCYIGVGSESESEAAAVPFQKTTPFKNKSSGSSLRRTRSFSDFGSRLNSRSARDANSAHLDSLFRQGRAASRRQSDDSESDAETMYSRSTYRSRQSAQLGASRRAAALQKASKGGAVGQPLRRSASTAGGAERAYKEIDDFLSCLGDGSDSEEASVFSGPTSCSRWAQSDAEDSSSVFSRLSRRPREQHSRAGWNSVARGGALQNGGARGRGTRAGDLRRSVSHANVLVVRDDQSETCSSSFSGPTSRYPQNSAPGASRDEPRRPRRHHDPLRRSASAAADVSDAASGIEGFVPPEESPFQDVSDSPAEAYYGMDLSLQAGDDEVSSDHPEEERTIRAVHTQNKERGGQEVDAISLYDAMRMEMRKAVSEIKSEIEQKSASKDYGLSPSEGTASPVPEEEDGNDSKTAQVRREYAAKLEQSERRAQDLWTQLAAEERRCLDLVKFVKEILPQQGGSGSVPPPLPPPQVRPLLGPEVEKQLVSQCLDADAQRYFDECVSISGLDVLSLNDASSCGAGYQESESPAWSVKDMTMSPRKKDDRSSETKRAELQPLITFCAQIQQHSPYLGKDPSVFDRGAENGDGLVLPWLQWETKLDLSTDEQVAGEVWSVGDDHGASSSSSSNNQNKVFTRGQFLNPTDSSQAAIHEEETPSMDIPQGVSGLGCLSNGDLRSCKSMEFGYLKSVSSNFTHDTGRREGQFDAEVVVLQRTLLRQGIQNGRILICGGERF